MGSPKIKQDFDGNEKFFLPKVGNKRMDKTYREKWSLYRDN